MFNQSALEIVIKAKDEASSVVQGFTSKLKEMDPAFKAMTAAGAVAFTAIAGFAGSALKEFAEDQAQMTRATQMLDNTLENMAANGLNKIQREVGKGIDIFDAMENKMKDVGTAALKLGFDDEQASGAFAKLFQITQDSTEAQKELNIAMDLARAKGIDLDAAVKILTLTHSGATKELKLQGIAIDENASAMDNINKIAKSVTGQAEAAAKTAKVQWDILTNAVNNTKSAIGGALAPVLADLLLKIQPIVEKMVAWTEAHPELTRNIFLVAGGLALLVFGIGSLILIIPRILAVFNMLRLAVNFLGGAISFLATNPIGWLIVAIGLLVAAGIYLYTHWEEVKAKAIEIWTAIKDFFAQIWDQIKESFRASIDSIVDFFRPLTDAIQHVLDLLDRVANSIGKVLSSASGKVGDVVKSIGTATQSAFGQAVSKVFGVAGARAGGGDVNGGQTYLVGENGPELFSPGSSGSIIPNNKINSGSGGSIVINLNGGNYLSQDAAYKMGDIILKSLQRQYRGA
jgi:uncharacterized protein YukE